ncbi:MAG: hypothetical protein WC242_00200 [Candidatus Paceibacterota bacterium]
MKVDASKVDVLRKLPDSVRREYEKDPEGFRNRRITLARHKDEKSGNIKTTCATVGKSRRKT